MLTLGLAVICSFMFSSVYGDVHPCDGAYRRLNDCNELWGYDVYASRAPSGNILNITQLINYCRTPERQDIGQCMISANGECSMGWPEERVPILKEQMRWTGRSIDYACSQVDVLDREEACFVGIQEELMQCIRSNVSKRSEFITYDVALEMLERTGRQTLQCAFELMTTECSPEIAKVLGNLYYGSVLYIYDVVEPL